MPRLGGVGRAAHVLADPVGFAPVRLFQGGFVVPVPEQEGVERGVGGLAKLLHVFGAGPPLVLPSISSE